MCLKTNQFNKMPVCESPWVRAAKYRSLSPGPCAGSHQGPLPPPFGDCRPVLALWPVRKILHTVNLVSVSPGEQIFPRGWVWLLFFNPLAV